MYVYMYFLINPVYTNSL